MAPAFPFLLAALMLFVPASAGREAFGQSLSSGQSGSHSSRTREAALAPAIERAMEAVCAERESDPLGSMPIDEMQARPSLPLAYPDSVAGAERAERLLPVARKLVITALRGLSNEYALNPAKLKAAALRVQVVTTIKPDMDSRDNASVRLREPHTINFGTIFLAGLRSDEAMISVIAHELTHIADGRKRILQPLFRQIGGLAANRTGLKISDQRSEELTADLIGAMVARQYIALSPNHESLARRMSRAVEHNCVDEDLTDEDHLSPRNTLRALFALDPALIREVTSGMDNAVPAESLREHPPARRLRRPSTSPTAPRVPF